MLLTLWTSQNSLPIHETCSGLKSVTFFITIRKDMRYNKKTEDRIMSEQHLLSEGPLLDGNGNLAEAGYKLWRKTHRLARGMKATFLCKTACPLLGICTD